MLKCDACTTEAKDLSSTMESIFHDHPLVLAYSLPDQYRTFRQFCNVCTHIVHPSGWWLYYCANCRFFAHLKCAPPSTHQMIESPSTSKLRLVVTPLIVKHQLCVWIAGRKEKRNGIQNDSFSWNGRKKKY